MKKLLLMLTLSLLPAFSFASGEFQLLNVSPSLPYGVSGLNYSYGMNFVYSGRGSPSATLVGDSLPPGIRVGDLYIDGNGVGKFNIKGIPSQAGDYKLNIYLTDTLGASLLKTFAFKVDDGSSTFNVTSQLPPGYVNEDYSGYVLIEYYDYYPPTIYYNGIPNGIFIDQQVSSASNQGILRANFYGKPTREGSYPITFVISTAEQSSLGKRINKYFTINVETRNKNVQPSSPLPVQDSVLPSSSKDEHIISLPQERKQKSVSKKESFSVSSKLLPQATSSVTIQATSTPNKENTPSQPKMTLKKILSDFFLNLSLYFR